MAGRCGAHRGDDRYMHRPAPRRADGSDLRVASDRKGAGSCRAKQDFAGPGETTASDSDRRPSGSWSRLWLDARYYWLARWRRSTGYDQNGTY